MRSRGTLRLDVMRPAVMRPADLRPAALRRMQVPSPEGTSGLARGLFLASLAMSQPFGGASCV